ncbi:hypothetical protein CHS0354_024170 [Potamilus streckersoni]|uniref:Prephenate dehydratase n=1 Tax=Potamilus streckersoni TaxID=2493646 RepID=A0AAE0VM30_9BIVA|nr:hypothetical protein CHS0354_024170 [Potamilus streckersoni]
MKIAIQGVRGAFHQIAAEERYGKGVDVMECPTFEDVCKAVSQKFANAGMLAIENTTIGSFLMNYKLIREYELFIIGEVCLQVHHNLLALANQKIEDLRIVRSQDYAIAQCSEFLKKHDHLKTEVVTDTALAAKNIADKQEMNVGAIASVRAAEIYGLQIIAEKIETCSRNFTSMKVAIQGVKGAFHEIAVKEKFGKEVEVVECQSFDDVCQAVIEGSVDTGIFAIEDTTVGFFLPNFRLILENNLFITDEIYLQIRHNLIALPNQKIEDLRVVRSQDIAIEECKDFLNKYPHLSIEVVADTALAAKHIANKKEKGVAVIASYRAAEIYGLDIVKEKIETIEHNYTRFLLVSKVPNPPNSSQNKATLLIDVKHEPGSLVSALNVFKIYDVNMLKIQSVPHPEIPFQFMMYLDVTWENQEHFEKAIEQLKKRTLDLIVCGLYVEGKINTQATEKTHHATIRVDEKGVMDMPKQKILNEIVAQDWRNWIPVRNNMPADYFLISGPCSAETEKQTRQTLDQLLALNKVSLFRAGVWKPRTRAGGFEGNGVTALKWLQKFQEETGEHVTVEVATGQHVKECLDHGINILWIGARTSANPFSVQEIANAVQDTDVVVMVKNPVNPDLELWIGAIERIANAGITKIAAIHRGFSVAEKSKYRNYPAWSLPLQLQERFPQLPMINDPSHICGKREFLFEVSQKAIDLGVNGFIIESHIDPSKAWTDAAQQLTPQALNEMLAALSWNRTNSKENEPKRSHLDPLKEFRENILNLDKDIIKSLGKRMEIVREIGEHKKKHRKEPEDPEYWNLAQNERALVCKELNLNEKFVIELFNHIQSESISIQK